MRLDRKATSISLLVVLGVRADQKVLLAIKSIRGESAEAWRTALDDLIKRGLRRPEFLIFDGAPGLDKAIAAVWDGVPVPRCTVHKHRNLLALKSPHNDTGMDMTNLHRSPPMNQSETDLSIANEPQFAEIWYESGLSGPTPNGVRRDFSRPGKPTDIALIEAFKRSAWNV